MGDFPNMRGAEKLIASLLFWKHLLYSESSESMADITAKSGTIGEWVVLSLRGNPSASSAGAGACSHAHALLCVT